MNNKNKGQRYYWFKLKLSFLDSPKVDFLMAQKNGSNYVVIYQMLCLKAIDTNGKLATPMNDYRIIWDDEKIQRECKYFEIDTIRIAMTLFLQLGLIVPDIDGCLQIQGYEDLIGSETAGAVEKRTQRVRGIDKRIDNVYPKIEKGIDKRIDNVYPPSEQENKKTPKNSQNSLLEEFDDNKLSTNTKNSENKETKKVIEKEKCIKEKEYKENKESFLKKEKLVIDKSITQKKESLTRFKVPSIEEIKAYCDERKNRVDPELFRDFYECKNWFVGKNKMKDWKAAVRTWERTQRYKNKNDPLQTDKRYLDDEDYID